MAGQQWEPRFSLLKGAFTYKQGQEARMIQGVVDQRWSQQHEATFSFLQKQTITHGNVYRYMWTQGSVHLHVIPRSVSREGLKLVTPPQHAHS